MPRKIQERKYVVPQLPGYVKVSRFFRVEQHEMEELIDKQMKAEKWVRKSIGYYDKDRIFHCKCVYDLPERLLEKYQWLIRLRTAMIQCQYPRELIDTLYSAYYLKDRIKHDDTSPYLQLRAAKAWLTRARKAQQQYELHKKQTLFPDYKNDPKWRMLRKKVKQKEHKLQRLQQQFDSYVESKRKYSEKRNLQDSHQDNGTCARSE